MSLSIWKYVPYDQPAKYNLGSKADLTALYKVLRQAATERLDETRMQYLHPEDRAYARQEYRVLDGAARAVQKLLRTKTPNAGGNATERSEGRVDHNVGRQFTEKDMNGRILTCVYCGHEYPQATPAAGSEVLTEHIRVCEKHPMRKAEDDIAMLRAALVGLIGVDGKDDLKQMEATLRLLPAPDADKVVSINAIHALLATVPHNY